MKEFMKNVPILKDVLHALHFLWHCMVQILSIGIYNASKVIKCRDNDKIKGLKNRYTGKRCFIVATGPSLTYEDLKTLQDNNEYTISMNTMLFSLNNTSYRPTFYFVQDGEVYRKVKDSLLNFEIPYVFIGQGNVILPKTRINISDAKGMANVYVYTLNSAYRWLNVNYKKLKPKYKFSKDCSVEVFDGSTVTYSAIQMAVYMGFSEIYLLGCDCNYDQKVDHFGGYHQGGHAPGMALGFIGAYDYADKATKEMGVKIYNATRGGMLEVFPRVSFDELFKKSS